MPRRKDIWRCGIINRPMPLVVRDGIAAGEVHWLPAEPRFHFLADPFAWRGPEHLHLFAERYDYANRHGVIDVITLDDQFRTLDRRTCLREPWHLSYPQVFDADGETWMLPEAHRSGTFTLYRMTGAPAEWTPECTLDLDCVPVDATPLRYAGRWWLFYSPATSKRTKQSHLHVAWAEHLCGPWHPHPENPVRIDRASSRPGGTAMAVGGRILLPVQDCSNTYGGAIRPLWIDRLDETGFSATAGAPLPKPVTTGIWKDGMHTLSACGDITLLDVKYIDRSLSGLWLDVRRMLR